MQGQARTRWTVTAGLIVLLPLQLSAGEQSRGMSTSPSVTPGTARPPGQVAVYKPPRTGAPGSKSRRGGGTRGANKSLPLITLLVPDHVGLTLQEQPTLYWFTPTRLTQKIEFTLTGAHTVTPLVESTLPTPSHAGLQQIRLSEFKVTLAPGEPYQWSVAVVLDPDERSGNIVALGGIERIDRAHLEAPLPRAATSPNAPTLYAEAGLWYDAIMAISELIASAPTDQGLRQQRATLLQEAGLQDLARLDEQPHAP